MFDVNPLTLTMNAVIIKLLLSNKTNIYTQILCVYIMQKKEENRKFYTKKRKERRKLFN